MQVGQRVEVRNRFDQSWSRGFEIAEIDVSSDGLRLRVRRRSDGQVLPAWFDVEVVREERRRETWWL